jgi:hypothetical protein
MWLFDPRQEQTFRLYKATGTHLYNTFYEKPSEGAHNLEVHCQVTLRGNIHENRQWLKDFTVQLYQRKAMELYGISFSPAEVKVRFEPEEAAFESSSYVTADFIEMTYVGKQVRSRRFPTETTALETEREEEPDETKGRSDQEFLNHRDHLVNAYARGYRDGSIAAGFPTSLDTARSYGREFVQTLREDDVWSWEERDAYDEGREDALEESDTDDDEDDMADEEE